MVVNQLDIYYVSKYMVRNTALNRHNKPSSKAENMMTSIFRPLVLSVIALWIFLPSLTAAADLTEGDKQAFQKIISSQIAAFRVDNADAAFAFASPRIQQIFRDPQIFITMVKQSYFPVYRPQSFEFGKAELKQGQPTQIVNILGPKGAPWAALYTFEKQDDGSWRISGVYLLRQEGAAA